MADSPEDTLVADLVTLGRRAVPRAAATPELTAAVMSAVVTLPTPGARSPARRRLVLVALAVLVALVATPPVRATVAEWFGFGGVRVEQGGSGSDAAPPPPAVAADSGVREAAARVSFAVSVPTSLGAPDGVQVSDDARVLSMTWTDDDGSVVRLDQLDGSLDFAMAKQSPRVQYAAVGGVDALWFEEPHEVVLLEADGTRRTESARLAGHTLIWPDGDTTLRLEGDLDLAEAVEVAESTVPVD